MSTESSNPAEALRQQLNDWLDPILAELEQAERQQQWDRVERLCKQALQRDGDNWTLWQQLARSHEARSDWAQAETLWRHLTQRFSSRPEPYLALAALQRRRGAPDAARVVLEQAERRVGDSDALRRSLEVIDDPWALGESIPQLGPGSTAQHLARALQLAQEHLDTGRFTEAEAVLEQIVQAKPQAGRVHLTLAQLRQRRGEADALIRQLMPLLSDADRAQDLPERLPLTLLLVQALLAQQRGEEAQALLMRLAPDPAGCGQPDLLVAQAECAIALGDDRTAQAWLNRCMELHPGLARPHRLQGELAQRLGDWAGAIQAFSRGLALDPADTELSGLLAQARCEQLWWHGETALQTGAWDEAAEAYRQLLQHEPGQQRALARLDLLASLDADQLETEDTPRGHSEADLKLAQFSAMLDRAEAQLKMFGVLG